MKKSPKIRQRKYQPTILIRMFRKAAIFRNEMITAGFTDNGGAIHSAERILNILGQTLVHPEISHINNLRRSKKAIFSVEALELHNNGEKVLIEHVSPIRDLTKKAIKKIEQKISDAQFKTFIKRNYKLVLLSPEETKKLNKQNRSKMHRNRLKKAGIRLATKKIKTKGTYP